MKEVAIYGKGGIGKSTVSANISAVVALLGKKVFQLGCDPKHDSTRLLLHGKNITTVLDYMREKNPQEYKLEDIIHKGIFDIVCVEAGGPEPGVGCAGRGILSTFELLDTLGLNRTQFDLVLYDVLGDVVCGGFAVPLRQEYADVVYIVTSGEYMSIYAANNILRGLKNYSGQAPRAGGIIFNARGMEEEEERVERFAKGVGLPIVARIPRDDIFSKSEEKGKCVVEAYPNSQVAERFKNLGQKIMNQEELYFGNPLTDEELEKVVLNRVTERELPASKEVHLEKKSDKKIFYSKSLLAKEPLHGCAYNGAMNLSVQINDGITISHGPKSCANLSYQSISSIGRRSLLEKSIVLPIQLRPKIMSTEMGESAMVFGGVKELEETLEKAIELSPKLITVISTCPSGIIGDDIEGVISQFKKGIPIVALNTNGNISGDYMQGMILAYEEIAKQLIDKTKKPNPYLVNFYGEKSIANATSENIRILEYWLGEFGAKINCRFLYNTPTDSVINLLEGGLNIKAYEDYMGNILEELFTKNYGVEFFPEVFPVGFDDSIKFLEELGKFYNKEEIANKIIDREKEIYREKVKELKPYLNGKKLMAVSYNHHIDWIIKTALDMGMEIVKVGLLNFSQDFFKGSKYEEDVKEWETDYTQNKRKEDVSRLKPDIVISNYMGSELDDCKIHSTIPLTPTGGFESGIVEASKWVQLFRQQIQEGWKNDEKYFKEYNA